MELRIIDGDPVEHEELSLRSPKKKEAVQYEAEKIDLGKNIQRFDKKVKVFKESPYSYNSVSQKKNEKPVPPVETANQMIANKTYNTIGKLLGIDTTHDWNRYYDKVYMITEWAKKKSGLGDPLALMRWIRSRHIPSIGSRKIDDVYIYASLQMKV